MTEYTAKVVAELINDAQLSDKYIMARAKSQEELIELAVAGFRELLEEMEEMEPDFSLSSMCSFTMKVPVIFLMEE